MPDSPIEIAKTFIDHWNADRMEDALAMLSDNVLYMTMPANNDAALVAPVEMTNADDYGQMPLIR